MFTIYEDKQKPCPYCQGPMDADWVDVGVGEVQCGPYHCEGCGASEIGPEWNDWYYKDRQGNDIYLQGKKQYFDWKHKWDRRKKRHTYYKCVMRYDAPFTKEEMSTGFYKGRHSPYANTIGGVLVDHQTAKAAYSIGLLDEKEIPENV